MYRRRDGCARYAPRWTLACKSASLLKVCFVVLPHHAVHARSRIPLEREKRQPKQVNRDMVVKRGEPFLLPLPCGLPYALLHL